MNGCIFCKIIGGDIPSDTVYENETVIVFKDISPVAPIHYVVAPKMHIDDINSLNTENAGITGDCMLAIKKAAEIAGIADSGYRVISNCGQDGGQSVNHLHFHLIGGVPMGERIL